MFNHPNRILRFIFHTILGVLYAISTEPEVFALAVVGVLIAVKTDAIVGFIVFLSAWIVLRLSAQYFNEVGNQVNFVGRVLRDNRHLRIEDPVDVKVNGER